MDAGFVILYHFCSFFRFKNAFDDSATAERSSAEPEAMRDSIGGDVDRSGGEEEVEEEEEEVEEEEEEKGTSGESSELGYSDDELEGEEGIA